MARLLKKKLEGNSFEKYLPIGIRKRDDRRMQFITGDELREVLTEVWGHLLSRGEYHLAATLADLLRRSQWHK